MKKYLLPVFLFLTTCSYGQFNNSWIDYNKTYYKFHLGQDGLTRLNQSVLATAGIGNIPAEQFQLWRNGQQVRIFTSVSTGALGPGGFIEFWGERNDGKPDTKLYLEPRFQLSDKYSLETDTVAYFLTVNPVGGNLRFVTDVNPAPGAMVAEPYFLRDLDVHYNSRLVRGLAQPFGQYLWSSSYDEGEGFAGGDVGVCCPFPEIFTGLNLYQNAPANLLTVRVHAVGMEPNVRNLVVKVDGTTVYSQEMSQFKSRKLNLTGLATSLITNPSQATITVAPVSATSTDIISLGQVGITYPATFKFNNQRNFAFSLQSAAVSRYLDIQDFNYGSTAPVLLNFTTGARYIGNISTPGRVKFVLPASAAEQNYMLVNIENPASINSLITRNFVSIANAANQGDFMIISHPSLYNDGSGNNYVDQYRQYRSTAIGGGFNAKIYDINELVDQFGFGIRNHPSSIRDFIHYASQQFVVKPKYVLMIGRGLTYFDYRGSQGRPSIDKLDLIPTFGWPASDMLLSALPGSFFPVVPIGRLGVISGKEIKDYLDKLKQYDLVQQTPNPGIASRSWMKNILHVIGGKDSLENGIFQSYMSIYEQVARDTLFGGNVETFSKSSAAVTQVAYADRIKAALEEGVGLISYFGHSSANLFEFNLSDPTIYNNAGKYPFFNVSGCNASNFYTFDPGRLTGSMTISEKYVLTPQKGSIGFIADSHFGVPPQLHYYNSELYKRFVRTMYGNTVGNQIKSLTEALTGYPNFDFLLRMHVEQMTLHGDPAVKINSFPKPDYVIEEQSVKITPNIISVADNNFDVNIRMHNIGKAIDDSIWILVKQKLPNDTMKILFRQKIKAIRYADSIKIQVSINPMTDKGLNQIIVTVDETNKVDEIYESNNTVNKDFYIFEDELRPIHPYNFSIVTRQNLSFAASTANPLSGMRQYVMEIDTTELFSSPFKKSYNVTGPGGLVTFTPSNLSLTDSTVYYWRVSMVPTANNPIIWNTASFIYKQNGNSGYNQSHSYQHLKSKQQNLQYASNNRWKFSTSLKSIKIKNGVFPTAANQGSEFAVEIDDATNIRSVCGISAIIFNVLSPYDLLPWQNNYPGQGLYGSDAVCGTDRRWNFQYNILSQQGRISAVNFLNLVPQGYYVVARMISGNSPTSNTYANDWKNDTLVMGSGNSLYHSLRNAGFVTIDSFNRPRAFNFLYKKQDASFTPAYMFSEGIFDKIVLDAAATSIHTAGTITSPLFGPAVSWKEFHWKGFRDEIGAGDSVSFNIIGVTPSGIESTLYTVDSTLKDVDISSINATQYPYLKLKMFTRDNVNGTPYQLRSWRVDGINAPEGAVAPHILFSMKDSADLGDIVDLKLAFKNVSETAFADSLKINLTITDRNNVQHIRALPKGKVLISGDTLLVNYQIDTRNYSGMNSVFVEINPNNDQLEQHHFNNILYKNLYVRDDKINPLLDVTFDGVHILNRDIVSAKPHILINLKDENKFLALRDTAHLKVQVRFPDDVLHDYHFGDILRFTPADLASGNNTATIDFLPIFIQEGEYELIVSGRDASGNRAGASEYSVIFNVITKAMISNLLNYPNPFTSSTAFVFTITGSEVPQNIRIQILTITGKIVREISSSELGQLHVGRNITDFKWDGTDQYGAKLANGVYLYRVITNLNGKSLEKYRAEGDKTDKYFNKGYGKMYILR